MNPLVWIKTLLRHFWPKNVTNSEATPSFSQTRDIFTPQSRDIKTPEVTEAGTIPATAGGNVGIGLAGQTQSNFQPTSERTAVCPYCQGKAIVKKGIRRKKLETVQLYFCNNCRKVFTPQKIKGKQFPLNVILDGLNFYNTGFTLEESRGFLKTKFGLEVGINTLSNWVKEYAPICRYARMRDFGLKLFSPHQVIQSVRLFHRQVFNFTYHKAKLALILQDYKHSQYEPLREFLDIIAVECPHQLFNESTRMSEIKQKFDLSQVLIREKHNFACRIAELVLQAVNDNKLRHETLQRFMLANDSVTVACETPVYIDSMDIEHMRDKLGFTIPVELSGLKSITGHIDILQVRNGELHILDYKPNAGKEKPIEQLTIYALALSRLTGIRLFNMKCAWFDEKSYFEFFPLHVALKKGGHRRKENPAQLKLPEPAQKGSDTVTRINHQAHKDGSFRNCAEE